MAFVAHLQTLGFRDPSLRGLPAVSGLPSGVPSFLCVGPTWQFCKHRCS